MKGLFRGKDHYDLPLNKGEGLKSDMWQKGDFSSGLDHWPIGFAEIGLALSLAIVFAIVVALVLLLRKQVRSWSAASRKSRDASDSLAILESKLANGTITLEEYQKIRKILAEKK